MTRLVTICLAAACALAALPARVCAGDGYLVPRKDFGAAVKRLRIEPVLDSLRESTVALIDQVDKGFTFSDEGMRDPAFANYVAQTKQTLKGKYFLAATILKLYEKNSRDSIKAVVDGKIRRALGQGRRYSLDTLEGADPDSAGRPAGGRLCAALRVDNTDPSRSRGKDKAHACAVVLSAWVYDKDGRPLWHAQTEVAQVLPDDTMGALLNDQTLDAAVKMVFKTLVK
jgi:hypothetical protein